ncbi:MAG: hypothetical protein DRP83_01315 [Planctomycetota bacterium]|nr:MAG: hypothetical protein DRP83_01315 [Planctomycetota bacterium]
MNLIPTAIFLFSKPAQIPCAVLVPSQQPTADATGADRALQTSAFQLTESAISTCCLYRISTIDPARAADTNELSEHSQAKPTAFRGPVYTINPPKYKKKYRIFFANCHSCVGEPNISQSRRER